VIKSFSRSRGSKGKERRTFERAGRETRGRHTTDLDSAALCASVDDKGRLGGREEEEVEWDETEGGRRREVEREGMPSERRDPHGYSSQSRGAPGRTGIGAAMNVGNYLSCIGRSALLLSWKSPLYPRTCVDRYPDGFEETRG